MSLIQRALGRLWLSMLLKFIVFRAIVCVAFERLFSRKKAAAGPRVIATYPAGPLGTATVIEFTCNRNRTWMAYVPIGQRFELGRCASMPSGHSPVLMAWLRGRAAGRVDVTDGLRRFCGPQGDFYGFPPPTVRHILPFLTTPPSPATDESSMEVMTLGVAACKVFGPDDALVLQ